MPAAIRIVGIDPGLRRTGWGVIELAGNLLTFVAAGSVTSDADDDLARRLVSLHVGLTEIMQRFVTERTVEKSIQRIAQSLGSAGDSTTNTRVLLVRAYFEMAGANGAQHKLPS